MLLNRQSHGGFEQYYYTGAGVSTIVPKVYYETRIIGTVRCVIIMKNYKLFHLMQVKHFQMKNLLSYSVTPFAGIVLGRLNGGTIGLNLKMDYKS